MNLISIESLCGLSAVGTYSTIEYADIKSVDPNKWDYPSEARVDRLFDDDLFLSGKDWLKMPAIIKNKTLTGNVTRSAHGEFITADIKVFVPFFNNEITIEMAKLMHRKMIVKVKLDDGYYLIGTPKYPLLFDYGFGTSAQAAGTKGYNCVWRGEMPNLARMMQQ